MDARRTADTAGSLMRFGLFFLLIGLLAMPGRSSDSSSIPRGKGRFEWRDRANGSRRLVTVWTWKPYRFTPRSPVLIVLHGMLRNGEDYRDAWIAAARVHGALLLVPEFDEAYFPGSLSYNIGNMYTSSLLHMGAIRNWERLRNLLRDSTKDDASPARRRLIASVPPEWEDDFLETLEESTLAKKKRRVILMALNGVIQNRDFYNKEAFGGVRLTAGGREFLAKHPDLAALSDGRIWRLNRSLLESLLGESIRPVDYRPLHRDQWIFSLIENLFEHVRRRVGSERQTYLLYGHSAGAQVVHRLVMFLPRTRCSLAVAANAGRYCWPDLEIAYPYGLGQTYADEDQLERAFARSLVILAGTEDTDENHPGLARSSRAMAQGKHRYERARQFFAAARKAAEALPGEFVWRLVEAEGIGHDNGGMIPHAVKILFAGDESGE